MVIVGVDPGLSGGIALLALKDEEVTAPNTRMWTSVRRMPTTKMANGKREIDIAMLVSWLHSQLDELLGIGITKTKDMFEINAAVVEQVNAMPKQGVTSTFTFGQGFGEILGTFKTLDIELLRPRPQEWKASVLRGTKKDKAAAIHYVKQQYPQVSLLVSDAASVPNDGLADAICIAEFGYRQKYRLPETRVLQIAR